MGLRGKGGGGNRQAGPGLLGTRRALEPFIGPPHRVSEIMNRRRRLTLDMIRRLELGTGIPASVLIQPYELAQEANPAAQRKFSSYLQPVAVT